MHARSRLLLCAVAAVALLGATTPGAFAQSVSPDALFELKDNDGILVDKTSFKVFKGNGSAANPAATLAKMGAKEVSANAIIYRSGGKLYIIDGEAPGDKIPQAMHDLKSWCPTCHWYTPGSYMR